MKIELKFNRNWCKARKSSISFPKQFSVKLKHIDTTNKLIHCSVIGLENVSLEIVLRRRPKRFKINTWEFNMFAARWLGLMIQTTKLIKHLLKLLNKEDFLQSSSFPNVNVNNLLGSYWMNGCINVDGEYIVSSGRMFIGE